MGTKVTRGDKCKNCPYPGADPDVEKDTNAILLRGLPRPPPAAGPKPHGPPVNITLFSVFLIPHPLSGHFSPPAGFLLDPLVPCS